MQQPQLGCLLSVPAFAAGLFAVKEILLPMQEETTDMNLPQVLPYLFCHEDFSCCLTTGRWWSSGQRCLWHTWQKPRCCRSALGELTQMPHCSELCPAREEIATAASIPWGNQAGHSAAEHWGFPISHPGVHWQMAGSIFASLTPGPFIQCTPLDYTDPCAQNLVPFLLIMSAGLTGDVTFL